MDIPSATHSKPFSSYGKYLHGEAIAIGQVAAASLSAKVVGLPARDVARITALFERAGLPTQVKLNRLQRTKLLAAMKLDKKVSGGEIKFVLAREIFWSAMSVAIRC